MRRRKRKIYLNHEFFLHVEPGLEQSGTDVLLQRPGPEDLGDSARRASPPELQLEQAIPGDVEALGEEQVCLILGVDM